MVIGYIIGVIVLFILMGIKQVNEYEKGVRFTLGKFTGVMKPGWRIVIPVFQSWRKIDMRVKTIDVPNQDAMTKDNVSCRVNAVLYYKIMDSAKAVIEVEDYGYAVSQLAQTTMRNVIGEAMLDKLLGERDEISQRIQKIVDAASDPWGIKVMSVDLKDIELPEQMKRTMAKEAEAERERRAVIIKAKGDATAAMDLSKAATTLGKSPGALHLRTLQSINDLSSDQSNTVVFALPLEVLRAFEGYNKRKAKK